MRNIPFPFLWFLISTLLYTNIFGQEAKSLVADTLFDRHAYFSAAEFYNKELIENDSATQCHCMRQLAICYTKLNDVRNAELTYRKLVNSCKTQTKDLKEFARILQRSGEVEKAKKVFEACYLADSNDHFAYQSMLFCDTIKKSFDGLTDIYLENQSAVNSSFDDILDDANNDTLIFLSARKSKNNSNRSLFNNQFQYERYKWHPLFKKLLNANQNLGNGFTTTDNEARDWYISNEINKGNNTHARRSVILRKRILDNGSHEENLFGYDDGFSMYGHPNLSGNGNLFFFISNMPGGFGGTDIYFCRKTGSKWSKPLNLGKEVNTNQNELFPFYLGEGLLVFASEGRPGYGGFDLYASEFKNDLWKEAKNLGFPVNSKSNDLAFRWDKIKKIFYLSSDRSKGQGGLDVYRIHRFDSENIKKLF